MQPTSVGDGPHEVIYLRRSDCATHERGGRTWRHIPSAIATPCNPRVWGMDFDTESATLLATMPHHECGGQTPRAPRVFGPFLTN